MNGGPFDRSDVLSVLMSVALDPAGQQFAIDPVYWRFAGRVNIGYQQHVGIIESAGEFIHQIRGARVPMRLEQDYDPPVGRPNPGRAQGRLDFRRMMTVIVNHGDARGIAFELKAPIGADEFAERMSDRVKRHF